MLRQHSQLLLYQPSLAQSCEWCKLSLVSGQCSQFSIIFFVSSSSMLMMAWLHKVPLQGNTSICLWFAAGCGWWNSACSLGDSCVSGLGEHVRPMRGLGKGLKTLLGKWKIFLMTILLFTICTGHNKMLRWGRMAHLNKLNRWQLLKCVKSTWSYNVLIVQNRWMIHQMTITFQFNQI